MDEGRRRGLVTRERNVRWSFLLVIALLSVAGCGDEAATGTSDGDATTTSTNPSADSTSTTTAEVAAPFVVATSHQLELWDASTGERVAVLTTAGEGRPPVAESYRLGPVSVGPDAVWFTEYEGPEDRPSIWRSDLDKGGREMVVDDAFIPAVSPDGRRLAYVRGLEGSAGGVGQWIVVRDIASGDEQVIESYDTGGGGPPGTVLTSLEWSPDGTKLLFAEHFENAIVGVLDPAIHTSLSDAVFLTDQNEAAAWIDDQTIMSLQWCCYPDETRSPALVLSDAASGAVIGDAQPLGSGRIGDLAIGPDGRRLAIIDLDTGKTGRLIIEDVDLEIEDVRSADW